MIKKTEKYRILSLEARELYNLQLQGRSFCVRGADGKLDFSRFRSYLYACLETEQIKETYATTRMRGKFCIGSYQGEGATLALVNVTFTRAQKAWNKRKTAQGYLYVREGAVVEAHEIEDHVCIRDNTVLAVEVPYDNAADYACVSHAQDVPSPFTFDAKKKQYRINENKITITKSGQALRSWMYENGFTIDGVQYVRYKRSAGSSREGSCLFIAKPLYRKMMGWTACGLSLPKKQDASYVVSWESYIALTLSGMQGSIEIPTSAILFLPEATSRFESDVVAVRKQGETLVAAEDRVMVENDIWDGQALLDTSVFEENGYGNKGMMLLRNRFFKTCAFHTKLQLWFADHDITQLSQLHPEAYTTATSISEIKLVLTDSSLKYIKLFGGDRIAAIKQWLANVTSTFGVVKTEKPTGYFDGDMVQTSYQLLNTIPLTESDVKAFLAPSLAYLWQIQSDPAVMRQYLGMTLAEDSETDSVDFCEEDAVDFGEEGGGVLSKTAVMELLARSSEFPNTKLYSEYRQDVKKSFVARLKRGHILVHGTNATLFGNGAEMLNAITDTSFSFTAPVSLALKDSQIRCTHFPCGKQLLCARSPHITMGNLLIAENNVNADDVYGRYFSLTDEIVCVNTIGVNLLQQLNGCDFDSDSMLITDDPILLKRAKEHSFPIPFDAVEKPKSQKMGALADLDHEISDNKIGDIVNRSQWLNSLYWDGYWRGEAQEALYRDICILAVLSGLEIDKAKRSYGVKANTVLTELKRRWTEKRERPDFLKQVKKTKSKKRDKRAYDESYRTAMQWIVACVDGSVQKSPRNSKQILLADLMPRTEEKPQPNDYTACKNILAEMPHWQNQLNGLRRLVFHCEVEEQASRWHDMHVAEAACLEMVAKKMKNPAIMRMLIQRSEETENGAFHRLLLACVCSANHWFYDLVTQASGPIEALEQDPQGDILIYGYRYTKR